LRQKVTAVRHSTNRSKNAQPTWALELRRIKRAIAEHEAHCIMSPGECAVLDTLQSQQADLVMAGVRWEMERRASA
jgi:hypothetical protein